MWQSSLRGHDFYLGLFSERRKPFVDKKKRKRTFKLGNSKAIINATKGDGLTRSSDETFVMKVEQRG